MLAIYLTLIDNEDDKKSFEDLYNQNRSKAYAIAFNILKNKTLAEEACSETFFSLAKIGLLYCHYVIVKNLNFSVSTSTHCHF